MEQEEIMDLFQKGYSETKKKFTSKVNILICGYTGSGKSSLIQSILGDDVVSQDKISDGAPQTMKFEEFISESMTIWDSKGLEAGDSEEEFMRNTQQFISERRNSSNVDDHIHIVWYTIQAPGARVTDCDLNLINNIFSNENTIVALTKIDSARPNQRTALKKKLIESGVRESRIIETSDSEGGAIGLKEIVKLTEELLPEAKKASFMLKQKIDTERRIFYIKQKSSKVTAIITTATAAAAATGASPIPFSDAAVLVPAQAIMIGSIAAIYGLNKEALSSASLPLLAQIAGIQAASSLSKLIPVAGNIISGSVAATITGALGAYVKGHFESIAIKKAKGEDPGSFQFFAFDQFKAFYDTYKKKK